MPVRTMRTAMTPIGASTHFELLVAGTTHEIVWTADDDDDVSSVDLWWSDDGGATWPNLIASGLPDASRYAWTVPLELCTDVRVKAVATDTSSAVAEAESASLLELSHDPQTLYDFSTGALR